MLVLDEDFVFHDASLKLFDIMASGDRKQLRNMLVGQGVEYLLAVPPPADEVEAAQEPQMVRDRGKAALQQIRQIADAKLFLGQKMKNLDPRFVRHGLEQLRKPGDIQQGGLQRWRLFPAGNAELAAQIFVHPILPDRHRLND